MSVLLALTNTPAASIASKPGIVLSWQLQRTWCSGERKALPVVVHWVPWVVPRRCQLLVHLLSIPGACERISINQDVGAAVHCHCLANSQVSRGEGAAVFLVHLVTLDKHTLQSTQFGCG